MSLIDWDAFLPGVHPEAPLCPEPVMLRAVRNSAIAWCEQTHCWKETLDPIPIGGGLGELLLPGTSTRTVWRVDAARIVNGPELAIESPERTEELYPQWREGTLTGEPDVLTQLRPDAFFLVPASSADRELVLTVSWKPKKDSVQTDSMLFDEYEEAICAGALARLQKMVGVPWSSPQMATANLGIFTAAALQARSRVSKAFGRAPIRVRAYFM
jgi:hypothetical protein